MNRIAKQANSDKNDAREMGFGLPDGEDGENDGVGFMQISKLYARHGFPFGKIFNRVCLSYLPVEIRWRINYIGRDSHFSNNGVSETQFGLLYKTLDGKTLCH